MNISRSEVRRWFQPKSWWDRETDRERTQQAQHHSRSQKAPGSQKRSSFNSSNDRHWRGVCLGEDLGGGVLP